MSSGRRTLFSGIFYLCKIEARGYYVVGLQLGSITSKNINFISIDLSASNDVSMHFQNKFRIDNQVILFLESLFLNSLTCHQLQLLLLVPSTLLFTAGYTDWWRTYHYSRKKWMKFPTQSLMISSKTINFHFINMYRRITPDSTYSGFFLRRAVDGIAKPTQKITHRTSSTLRKYRELLHRRCSKSCP